MRNFYGETRWEHGVRFGQSRALAFASGLAACLLGWQGTPGATGFALVAVMFTVDTWFAWGEAGR